MKRILLLSIILISSSTFLKAQFTGNPASPLSVCNATNTQATVHAFSDDKGGYYTFWIDDRISANAAEIYGQHLTSAGKILWQTNGRLIINPNNREILDFKCVPWQKGMLIAWMQGTTGSPDTMMCQYIDTAGASIWPNPVLVANTGNNSIIYLETDGFNIFQNSFGATIAYAVTVLGGGDDFSFNRIDFSGKLRWPINNFEFVHNSYYNYRTSSDGTGGMYTLYKGNGLGSPMAVQHYDTSGAELFSVPLVFTPGAGGGVSNTGDIAFNLDVSNNLYITWDDYTGKVLITKVTPKGTLPWAPAYLDVSNYNSSQSYSYSILNGGKIYTIWTDNRPAAGNTSFYVQKTDTSGVNNWTPGGVSLGSMNSNSPYPKIVPSDSGSVIAMYETNSGFYGQKIRTDSTLEYAMNSQQLSTQNNDPFDGDFELADDNNNECAAAFWSNGVDIFGAQLCSPLVVTGVKNIESDGAIHLFPNPSSSFINWNIPNPEADNLLISISDLSGRQVYRETTHASTGTIDVSTFSKGMYILQSVSGNAVYSRKLVVE